MIIIKATTDGPASAAHVQNTAGLITDHIKTTITTTSKEI
jgi:hypothetical protein